RNCAIRSRIAAGYSVLLKAMGAARLRPAIGLNAGRAVRDGEDIVAKEHHRGRFLPTISEIRRKLLPNVSPGNRRYHSKSCRAASRLLLSQFLRGKAAHKSPSARERSFHPENQSAARSLPFPQGQTFAVPSGCTSHKPGLRCKTDALIRTVLRLAQF